MENNILNPRPLNVFVILAETLTNWRNPQTEEGKAMLMKHYAWGAELKANGKLLLAGPTNVELMTSDKINPVGMISGLIMLNVNSREEAEKLAFQDPFHINGFRKNVVHSIKISMSNHALIQPLEQIIC